MILKQLVLAFLLIVASAALCDSSYADGFDDDVCQAIGKVSRETGVPWAIVESLVRAESGGNPGAVRYCKKWTEIEDGSVECLSENQASCRTRCYRRKIWNNRLDTGLYQLRNVPYRIGKKRTRSWNWFRWYERTFKVTLPKHCALDVVCTTQVVVEVIPYMMEQPMRRQCRKPGRYSQHQWLKHWNGCGAYRGRVADWLNSDSQSKPDVWCGDTDQWFD